MLTPLQRAIGLLTRREHSRKELTRKLTARGIDADAAHAAVDRLAEAGWQDNTRFAQALVRSRAGNGYGPVRIRAELATHGLERDCIQAALDAFEGDWIENARSLIARRCGGSPGRHPAMERKAIELLIRRGFRPDQIRAATGPVAEDD